GLARHRLDAGAENLDVERAGVERKPDRRPGEVRYSRHRQPGRAGQLEIISEREIEEIELHQRRRVAEELDVALGERANGKKARPLDPRPDDPDGDARNEAHRHQAERSEKAIEKTRAVERVIENREIDSGGLMDRPEPLPQRIEIDHSLRFP